MSSDPGIAGTRAEPNWRKPREPGQGLVRYVETVRERIWLVLGVAAVTVLVAVLYLATAESVYEAKAEMLITPIGSEDPALSGLALIRASSDPSRDVETAATLATSRDVSERVREELGTSESAEELVKHVSAAPVAQSNVVTISAQEGSPERAAEVANAYAEGLVADRDAKLRAQLEPIVASFEERIEKGEEVGAGGESLSQQLATLESLEAHGDPTVQLEAKAAEPASPVSPRPALTMVVAIIGGLILGIGAAFLVQAVDPRLRREEQLRELYGLPILARIPREPTASDLSRRNARRGARRPPLAPSSLSPRTLKSYRMLRTMLSAALPERPERERRGRAILITGPSPAEGKTTTAINLASSYAMAGKRVILIEADFRRPTVALALKVIPAVGVDGVLLDEIELDRALVRVAPFGDKLRVLPARRSQSHLSELLSMPTARTLLDEARELADYVIVDSPPLTEVIDALPLAHYVDDVLIVCRIGMSSLPQLSRLADLFEQNGIVPRGLVVVGVASTGKGNYYFDSAEKGPTLGPENGSRGKREAPAELSGS